MSHVSSAWLVSLLAFGACASVSGTQSFESVSELSLPAIATIAGTGTITAEAAPNTRSFAEVVLEDLTNLREERFVDSVELQVEIKSLVLDADTTFAGVEAVRIELASGLDTISLCNQNLSPGARAASQLTCDVGHILTETDLQELSASAATLNVELDLDGEVTARQLTAAIQLEVQVDADVSL